MGTDLTLADGTTWTDIAGGGWEWTGAATIYDPGDWTDVQVVIEIEDRLYVIDPGLGVDVPIGRVVDPASDGNVSTIEGLENHRIGYGSTQWFDITDHYVACSVRSPSRERWGTRFGPGSATVTLLDPDGRFSPSNPDGVNLRVGAPLRISAQIDGDTYRRFTGEVKSVSDPEIPGQPDLVTVAATSTLAQLARVNRVESASQGDGETSGDRIWRILRNVGLDPSDHSIDFGDVELQATTLDGNALAELYLTAESEGGELLEDQQGRVVFHDRDAADALAAASPAFIVADRAAPATEFGVWVPWAKFEARYNRDDIRNLADIGELNSDPQRAADVPSIHRHGLYSVAGTDLVSDGNQWPAVLAQRIVDRFGTPIERVVAVDVTGGSWRILDAVASADLLDVVATSRLVGDVEVTQDVQIVGITESWAPARRSPRSDTWRVAFATDPVYLHDPFTYT